MVGGWHCIFKSIMNNLVAITLRKWPTAIEAFLLRLADTINSRGWIFVGIFGIAYFFMACYKAKRKLFWFDEIFTVYISRLPDFSAIVDALKHGADLNPPLFYEWVRVSAFFLNDEHLATRMPSIIGVGTLCLCLYRFVSLRSSAVGGLIAGLFPLVTGALYYSYEARPHGIVVGFAALALVCWQSAIDPAHSQRRLGWLLGLGLALVCATLTHGYALVIFAPLSLAELYRCLSCRRIDWAMCATFALASTAMIAPFWMLHVVKQYVPAAFYAPSFTLLAKSYISNLGEGLPMIALAFGMFLSRPLTVSGLPAVSEASFGGPTRFELLACLGFVAIPVIVFLLSLLTGAPQLPRYSLTCVIGFAALVGFSVPRKSASGLYLVILLIGLIGLNFMKFCFSTSIVEPSSSLDISTFRPKYEETYNIFLDSSTQSFPILVVDKMFFPVLLYYAPQNLRNRLTILFWNKSDSIAGGAKALQNCCNAPGQVLDGNDFMTSNKTFFVFTSQLNDLDFLVKFGASVSWQKTISRGSFFFVRLP